MLDLIQVLGKTLKVVAVKIFQSFSANPILSMLLNTITHNVNS